jgi:hypothetical protein
MQLRNKKQVERIESNTPVIYTEDEDEERLMERKKIKTKKDHPPYKIMVCEAVAGLKDPKGRLHKAILVDV